MISKHNVKTVLFLSSWFPNRVTPYNGDFVERHALAVSEVYNTIVIYVTADSQITGRFFEFHEIHKQKLTEYIIYFKRSHVPLISGLINTLFYSLGYFAGYRKMKKTHGKPAIIHANIIYPIAVVARWISIFTRIPYIISEHWTLFLTEGGAGVLQEPTVRKAVDGASFVVPVTVNLSEALKKYGFKTRYRVVPNVTDTNVFIPAQSGQPEKVRFVHVSSMKEMHKNISGMIRVISRLKETRSGFCFTFIGEATEEQKNLAAQLVNNDIVIFAGEVPHSKVPAVMQASDVLVLFSRIENLPCVIPEALSSGIPVISSDVGGISEWINESNGILVEPENEDRLLEAMIFMMDHHKEYDKTALHGFAQRHFSPAVIAAQFSEIYQEALKPGRHD